MSEEEKKAIEWLKKKILVDTDKNGKTIVYSDILSNLIDKKQKEIEELKLITNGYDSYLGENMGGYKIIIADSKYFLNGTFVEKFISKDKISEKIKALEKLYEKEMKPYQTEFGLNLSLLTKKEKEEIINKRNSLLIEIETLKELLKE